LRQLEKAKRSQDELVDAVYNAARDAAAGMRVPPVPSPKIDKLVLRTLRFFKLTEDAFMRLS
jgi:hypothetical protein